MAIRYQFIMYISCYYYTNDTMKSTLGVHVRALDTAESRGAFNVILIANKTSLLVLVGILGQPIWSSQVFRRSVRNFI